MFKKINSSILTIAFSGLLVLPNIGSAQENVEGKIENPKTNVLLIRVPTVTDKDGTVEKEGATLSPLEVGQLPTLPDGKIDGEELAKRCESMEEGAEKIEIRDVGITGVTVPDQVQLSYGEAALLTPHDRSPLKWKFYFNIGTQPTGYYGYSHFPFYGYHNYYPTYGMYHGGMTYPFMPSWYIHHKPGYNNYYYYHHW